MKRFLMIGSVLMLALVLGMPGLYAQQQDASPQGQGWLCPWGGPGGTMQQGRGMGGRMGRGCGMRCNQGQPLTKEEAVKLLDGYLSRGDTPDLKVGDVADKGDVFEATILNKDGSVQRKIQVDKQSGWFRNVS